MTKRGFLIEVFLIHSRGVIDELVDTLSSSMATTEILSAIANLKELQRLHTDIKSETSEVSTWTGK